MKKTLAILSSALLATGAGATEHRLQVSQDKPEFSNYCSSGSAATLEGAVWHSPEMTWSLSGPMRGCLSASSNFPTQTGESVAFEMLQGYIEAQIPISSLACSVAGSTNQHEGRDNYFRGLFNREWIRDPTASVTNLYLRLTDFTFANTPGPTNSPILIQSKGIMVSAGVTNEASMPLRVVPSENGTLRIFGKTVFKLSDFYIPRMRGMAEMKLDDPVRLSLQWHLVKR